MLSFQIAKDQLILRFLWKSNEIDGNKIGAQGAAKEKANLGRATVLALGKALSFKTTWSTIISRTQAAMISTSSRNSLEEVRRVAMEGQATNLGSTSRWANDIEQVGEQT